MAITTATGRTPKGANMNRFLPILLVIVVAAGFSVAQQHAPMSVSTAVQNTLGGTGFGSGAAGPIGNGDLLEMSVFDTPELSGKLRVSNTGEVNLPLLGTLHVTGMKSEEAAAEIRQKFIDGDY